MDVGLDGKVFFVTGAASGIGASAADILLQAGASVCAFDLNRSGLDALVAKGGDRVLAIAADLGEPEQIRGSVRQCVERFGRVDTLLHFAAMLDSHQIEDTTPEIWDRVMVINLRGSFLIAQAVVPFMREQKYGRIVLTASDSARMGSLVSGPAYACSKGGVIALTRSLALNLGKHSITCNAVCPGLTMTGMSAGWADELIENVSRRTPLGRLAQPDEIARVAIFIGSDAANFMTGEVVEVNGGVHFD